MRTYLTLFSVLVLMVLSGRGVESASMYGSQDDQRKRSVTDQTEVPVAPFLKGGILVAEGNKGRLLLLDRATKRVVWQSSELLGAYCVASLPTGEIVVGEGKTLAVIDSNGNLVSRLPATFQRTTDVRLLEGGGLLVSDGPAGTVAEIDWNGNVVWSVSRLHWPSKAIRLQSGNTLVADGTRQLKEFDFGGALLRTTKLARWAAAVHRRSDGNTLVGQAGAVELIDPEGKPIWSRAGFERATSVQELSTGEILVCDPDGGRVVILDANGEIIWERKGLALPWHAIALQ